MMIHTPLPKGMASEQTIGAIGRGNLTKAHLAIELANNEHKAIEHWEAAIKEFEDARDYFNARKWAIVRHIGSLENGS